MYCSHAMQNVLIHLLHEWKLSDQELRTLLIFTDFS